VSAQSSLLEAVPYEWDEKFIKPGLPRARREGTGVVVLARRLPLSRAPRADLGPAVSETGEPAGDLPVNIPDRYSADLCSGLGLKSCAAPVMSNT
jgi:hypothetical protein